MLAAARRLPPTVNMHVVGHCNFRCGYCYARFGDAKRFLPLPDANGILAQLAAQGVSRITFAGGEPTLHPDLVPMLRKCAELELVTSLVTNASQLDRDACRRLFPWLRWLVLSCDSHEQATNEALGRTGRGDAGSTVERVEQVADWLHEWNARRAPGDRPRLKVNIVVTALNVHEDPSDWLRRLAPERVKLLQCCIVPGENDDAEHLRCPDDAFGAYRARVAAIECAGIKVVAECSADLFDSYAMVDPFGRFRQAHVTGHVESDPIQQVGVDVAWQQVGGCDLALFKARGGEYDPGEPCRGVRHPILALEGLDGSGKSSVARELAAHLGAELLCSPPCRLGAQRAVADTLPTAERRAWYWEANRLAMRDATDVVFGGRAVVMDRCFASTAAYGAAERGSVASGADVPPNMPRPDLVFLLSLPEAQRQRRLTARGGSQTSEETRLSRDEGFRRRVLDGYAALGARPVDATGDVAAVVAAIVEQARTLLGAGD